MGRFINFIKYNNALPIAFAVIFLSATGALAANDDVRAALISSEQKLASIDNSYIRNVNLDAFTPSVQITNVSEDDEWYFVSYTLSSIGIEDGVWREVTKGTTLKVSKTALGDRDLGLYVTKELKEIVDRELVVLRETQQIEKRAGETSKVVATAYSGLVGKFLDSKQEVIEGYDPIKPPPPPPKDPVVDSGNDADTDTTALNPSNGDSTPPSFQLLGNNPARVALGSNWSDLGAYVTDDTNPNIGYTTEGVESVDTHTAGEYTVTYRAVDEAGNAATATRLVVVYDPNAVDDSDDTPVTSSTTTSTSTDSTSESSDTASSTDSMTDDSGTDTAASTEPAADTTAPSITLLGSASVSVEEGGTYADARATASDDVDGDISEQIVVTGSVDTSTPGEYTISYDVSDAAGNAASSVVRTVTVTATPEPEPEPEPEQTATSTDDGTDTGGGGETATSTSSA